MVCSDSNSVTLLSIDSSGKHSFHIFDLQNGLLEGIPTLSVPSFGLHYSVSSLPNIQVGTVSYPNLLLTGERNDSVFLLNIRFTQQFDFIEVLDVAYLSIQSHFVASTDAVIDPATGAQHIIASFFTTTTSHASVHALIKVWPNHQLEVAMMDSVESQKLAILHYVKDVAFLDGYYYLTGYNSPISAIVDTNLKVVDMGNTNYYDAFNSDNDYSLRSYVTRQIAPDHLAIIGDGYYGTFPPTVKPTKQMVRVENGEIVFEDHTAYTTLDREIKGVEATYPSSAQPAIFLAGAEPETFLAFTFSYIYFKKLVDGEEVLYKRYGNDHYYEVTDISIMENGNLLVCGFTIDYHGIDRFEGFFMFLDQEGNALVSTHAAVEPPQKLGVYPMPASNRIFFKTDLTHSAYI